MLNRIHRHHKQEFVYKDCTVRLSNRAMADLMYAAIMTGAGLPTSFGGGIYEYDRKQNAYNSAQVKVYIHPKDIALFEELSGLELREPIRITLS